MGGVIRAGALLRFAEAVRDLKGDPNALLRSQNIPIKVLQDHDLLIPIRKYVALLKEASIRLDAPDFGLRLGQRQDIGIFAGPLVVAIENSQTVGEALQCTSRWLFVQSRAVELTLIPPDSSRSELAEMRFYITDRSVGHAPHFVDQSLATLDSIIRHLGGNAYRLKAVNLDHMPKAKLSTYRRVFGVPVRTAQAHASVEFDASVLNAQVRSTDELLQQIASDYLDHHYAVPEQNIVSRVSALLSKTMGASAVSRDRVADMIGLHPRTLHRYLAAEGVTFEELRDEERRASALRYLTGTRLPMDEIAQLLGLSQGSALTRACRRWFNATPQMLRTDPSIANRRVAKR